MADRIGTLEDCGGSVVICDHCEDVFSKVDRRYHDGDECPTCRDGQAEPNVIAAANAFRIVALGSRPTQTAEGK